jgi:uncharacterized protein YlxW (UPF0749 family)
MSFLRASKRLYFIIALAAMFCLLLINVVQAVTAEPGTDEDPVVAKSYVDAEVDYLKNEIRELNKAVRRLTEKLEQQENSKYDVVELRAGERLIAGESTEIIVRSGQATAISGKNGDGLSDITTDDPSMGNLVTGQTIPLNHLLLVARDDGRGVKAVSSRVYMLVRGTYEIE